MGTQATPRAATLASARAVMQLQQNLARSLIVCIKGAHRYTQFRQVLQTVHSLRFIHFVFIWFKPCEYYSHLTVEQCKTNKKKTESSTQGKAMAEWGSQYPEADSTEFGNY